MLLNNQQLNKQSFANPLTAVQPVEVLDVNPEWVTVIIDEYERENWATEGVLHSIKFGDGHGRKGVEPTGRKSTG